MTENKPHKQRFKGVEHFLRRVAFNLGNTPSQTEVKIISCIPIDVTDLQAKIQFLERQLQETVKHNVKKSRSKPSAQVTPPLIPLEVMGDVKSGEGVKSGGVGANNGGVGDKNSSVTAKNGAVGDKNSALGDKGGALGDAKSGAKEKSGASSDKSGAATDKSGAGSDKNQTKPSGTVVNTILYGGSYANQSKTIGFSSDKSLRSSHYRPSYSGASRRRKSNVSFVLPSKITADEENSYYSSSSHENADPNTAVRNIAEAERKLAAAEHFYNNFYKTSKKKKKVRRGKSKQKTHLVYFAQHTENSPFNTNVSLEPFKYLNNNVVTVSHAYLDNVIRKQYDPKFVIQECSDTSHFSQPVCRDFNMFASSPRYESDVCSCCHGRFQNIDNYLPKGYDFINKITQCEPTYKTYYDSNLYDVVPVKENNNKFLKDGDLPKRDIEIRCWPEQKRNKYRTDLKSFKYQAESSFIRDNLTGQTINRKGKSENSNGNFEQKRQQIHTTSRVTPKRFYTDCNNTNRNNTLLSAAKKSKLVKTIVLKNELVETDPLNKNPLLNNQSTQLELIPDDNKTESALNQIKSILQSVLAEVKTNSQVNGPLEKTPKKDAVVQKGASQYNMQGQSTLLHSFTYNPSYNTNPYLPSCSRQHSAGQYCLPGVPFQPSVKYLQNFPVFVHPSSGRRLCACYYKNDSNRSSKYKQASAAATNTDQERIGEIEKRAGNKETEKLIKEIYKSMAVNMDFPTKDNSVSDYDDVKSIKNDDFKNKKSLKDVRSAGTIVNKRDIKVETLITSDVSSNSKLVFKNTGALPKNIAPTYLPDESTTNETNRDQTFHRYEQHSAETILEDDEESLTSSVGEDDNIVNINQFEAPPKHEKKGLLRRMFNSVKMFKKKRVDQKTQNESDVSEASDSDDYETIYSGRTAMQPTDMKQRYKYRLHPKGIVADQNATFRSMQEKSRRSPYMEQEYRRQWNERLLFDKQQEMKYSSERPISRQSPIKEIRPVYWNNYETRSVLVDNKQSPLKYVLSKSDVNEKSKSESLKEMKVDTANNKPGWFKKRKFVNCGEQWKKFIMES